MGIHGRSRGLALLVLLLTACDASPTGSDVPPPADHLPIDIPSAGESRFAETRDFTVVGYFDPPLARPGDLRIELFAGATAEGTPLRVVRSHVDPETGLTPRAALDFAYDRGQAWGPDGPVDDPAAMVMTPDLVAVPGGIEDPTNKVVVTSRYYAAVVLGGVSSAFDTRYGDGATDWTDLTAGTYTLRVTGLSGQIEGLTSTKQMEFGRTHAMLGRFSPEPHREALLAYAAANGYRTYIDFFPGFFSHDGYSFEIPGRWMANNSVEVVNTSASALVDDVAGARNEVLLYNISPTSATQRIEIGAIVAHDLLDGETTFYHYDIGEPTLTYVDATSGDARTLAGRITPFPPGDRLVITRVETRAYDGTLEDNRYDMDDQTPMHLDTDPDDGIRIGPTDEFSIYGVVTPIPASVDPGDVDHQYEVDDAVRAIRYEIRDGAGTTVHDPTRAVTLERRYSPADTPERVSTSIYEFEHEFRIASGEGSYTVTMVGLDTRGEPVARTFDSLTVTIGSGSTSAVPPGRRP